MFQPKARVASKANCYVKISLAGPAGSGKTVTALRLAHALAANKRVLVFCTERGRAAKYAGDPNPDGGVFAFDVIDDVPSYAPDIYMSVVEYAVREGYDVLIIDSLSHAWMGDGGILEIVDRAGSSSSAGGKNTFSQWKTATPLQNRMIATIMQQPIHTICTMRTSSEWVMEKDEKGKMAPREVGTKLVQREGVAYEFDFNGLMDQGVLTFQKSMIADLLGQAFPLPGEQVASYIRTWMRGDEAPTTKAVLALLGAAGLEADARLALSVLLATVAHLRASGNPMPTMEMAVRYLRSPTKNQAGETALQVMLRRVQSTAATERAAEPTE